MKYKLLSLVLVLLSSMQLQAGTPACSGPGEVKVSWPTINPVWELCYLTPANSSAAQGSSIEIRDAYYNGHLVLERSHVPMLFANYLSGTCYRDWKNTNSSFLKADRVENPHRAAITTCDASTSPTQTVNSCPFQNVNGSGSVGNAADCFSGVQVEKYPDRLLLTTNHSAAWYKYSSRYTFYLDGRIQPRFGFGNSDGTNFGITHWHHAYWRVNFDIDGADNDQVFFNEAVMDTEFSSIRDGNPHNHWMVKDSVTGRGYRIEMTAEDLLVDTDPTGDHYHEVDVMATKYKLVGSIPEYSDTPGSNNLGTCSMNENALVNGESLIDEDVVFWYRTAVNDIGGASLNCKSGGPIYYPVGDWGVVDYIYAHNFD
jgi:hypothetical protein